MHRLDVGTSGLMVVAKSERAYTLLKAQFRDRVVDKKYHALVQGHPDPMSGTIDAPIGRHPNHDYKWAVTAEGKPSVTHYDLIEAYRAASLLDIKLETGRTHQIRVHMSAHRHPCVGDLTYGADPTLAKRLGLTRQWLHAVRLGFEHPSDGKLGGVLQHLPGRPPARPRHHLRGESVTAAPTSYSTRRAVEESDLQACFQVRKEVFVGEQNVPEELEYDAHDATAVHVLAVAADGTALGTGRLLHGADAAGKTGGDPAVGSLGRLAVSREARGLGVGAALVRAIEDEARALGLAAVDLHAQTHALGFYERLGYVAYGPEFPDAGMPHRAMRREIRPA